MHYFLVTKSYEQIDIMALFSNLRRNRVSRYFHNAVWGRGRTNKELAGTAHGLVSRRRQRKVVAKGALFATAMISQGILRGVQIMEGKMVSIRCAHWNLDISVCILTITVALS